MIEGWNTLSPDTRFWAAAFVGFMLGYAAVYGGLYLWLEIPWRLEQRRYRQFLRECDETWNASVERARQEGRL